ncbi:UNVERIFIED_CONTAM: hypothetical protein FKN15_023099 [Acipenser sinensis]
MKWWWWEGGEEREGKKRISVFDGLIRRYWRAIQDWIAVKQAVIRAERSGVKEGKEKKIWVSSAKKW